jgi:hypothetical protein
MSCVTVILIGVDWHNILINSDTLEIKCIIDWEYAGFYLKEMEWDWWRNMSNESILPETNKLATQLYNL